MDYIEQFSDKLRNSVENLPISESTKHDLLNCLLGPLSFYTFLPLDVLQSQISDQQKYKKEIESLSLYASYYVSSIILTDKIVDNEYKVPSKVKKSILEYLFFIKEHAVLGLGDLLKSEDFWKGFDKLKLELFGSSSYTNKNFYGDDDLLMHTLLSKSALAKAYVDSMRIILGESLHWDEITKALKDFHIAFQLYDDYEDLGCDIISDQLNYYLYKSKDITSVENSIKIKIIFLNGTVEKGLSIALMYAKSAEKIFSRLNMQLSHKTVHTLRISIENSLFEIGKLKEKSAIKAQLSNVKAGGQNIQEVILNTQNFIFQRQKDDATWADFMTSAGIGTSWVTGFVVSMLGEFPNNRNFLSETMRTLLQKGGRYNEYIIEDGDSYNFLLKSKQLLGYEITEDDIKKWHKFKHPTGGFSTYCDNNITKVIHFSPDSNISGWIQEQNCVSAVACWVAKNMNDQKDYLETRSFLENQIDSNGELSSYWWTESIYTMAFATMCGLKNNVLPKLIEKQTPFGYWLNMGKPSVFYTALSLKALEEVYLNDRKSSLLPIIEKGVDWLLTQQFDDGSWPSEFLLRIPNPSVRFPSKEIKKWRRSSFGFNIITDDFERVFTSAVVYNALKKYEEYCI